MDDNNRIIIRRISRNGKTGAPEESMHIFGASGPGTGNRWLSYLLFAPFVIIMTILGIFFFTAFLALFAIAAAGIGFRLWWLRRKLHQAAEAAQAAEATRAAETTETDYAVIEDAEIIEETTDRTSGFHRNEHRNDDRNERPGK